MKKGFYKIFAAIFAVFLVGTAIVSAELCKGDDGYYHDCTDYQYTTTYTKLYSNSPSYSTSSKSYQETIYLNKDYERTKTYNTHYYRDVYHTNTYATKNYYNNYYHDTNYYQNKYVEKDYYKNYYDSKSYSNNFNNPTYSQFNGAYKLSTKPPSYMFSSSYARSYSGYGGFSNPNMYYHPSYYGGYYGGGWGYYGGYYW